MLQHHERVNGSGYPVGPSGEDVLLEARTLGSRAASLSRGSLQASPRKKGKQQEDS
ncbi:MAG: hypothetical protein ISS50_09095 [Anaerolineae bacterium]|nr:hypothetical protein [Anaerolineae bacterium]